MLTADWLSFERDGAVRHDRAALPCLGALKAAADALPLRNGGHRIHGDPAISRLLVDGAIALLASNRLGGQARPVRAVLFDKTAAANWTLGWHQDRTIAVRSRLAVAGYDRWTRKQGLIHVEPPFSVIERMVTLRVHIDAAGVDNAPLLIAPGSHRCGKLLEGEIASVVDRLGSVACLAEVGDVWVYATPILHASAATQRIGHRRVLQVDYSAEALPGGLEWLGI